MLMFDPDFMKWFHQASGLETNGVFFDNYDLDDQLFAVITGRVMTDSAWANVLADMICALCLEADDGSQK